MKDEKDAVLKGYLLRNVPRNLWRRALSKAALEGKPIRGVLLMLLEKWVAE